MRDISPETPEGRRRHPDLHPHGAGFLSHFGPGSRPFEFARRVVVGVYNDGFIHAGNLAYLTLLALFPFFIIIAAATQLIGRPDENLAAIHSVLKAFPPAVADMANATAMQVLTARTGPLLWLGAAVGIWTVGSFIETIRDILRRAYGTPYSRPFWQYRLIGLLMIFASVSLLMLAFSAQILLTTTEEVITRFFPAAQTVADRIGSSRFLPTLATFVATFLLFWTLSPTKYRGRAFPTWPGALVTTLWWYASLTLLPRALDQFGGYALTYGGLAGVMVALLFFWLVGYGLVIGAHINAALANPDQSALKRSGVIDEIAEAKWLDI